MTTLEDRVTVLEHKVDFCHGTEHTEGKLQEIIRNQIQHGERLDAHRKQLTENAEALQRVERIVKEINPRIDSLSKELHSRIDLLGTEIEKKLKKKFKEQTAALDKRFDEQATAIGERFDEQATGIGERFDEQATGIGERFDGIDAQVKMILERLPPP